MRSKSAELTGSRFDLAPSFTETCVGDSHPLAMLPATRAVELERRLRYMAVAMWKQYGIDAEDLFQEGVLGVVSKFAVGDTIGHAINYGRWAMKTAVCREMVSRDAVAAAIDTWSMVRGTSRTFEGLRDHFVVLNETERQFMNCWLDGESLTVIARAYGKQNAGAVRMVLISAAIKIADSLGECVNVAAMFPSIARLLPKGVSRVNGKFTAKVCLGGEKHYLGSFATADEAVKAREKFITSNAEKRFSASCS